MLKRLKNKTFLSISLAFLSIFIVPFSVFGSVPFITPYSGTLLLERNDIADPGSRMPLSFTRFYNGKDLYPGTLGSGWSHNYEYELFVEDKKDKILFLQPNNNIDVFKQVKKSNRYNSVSGNDYLLREENKFIIHLESQGTFLFDLSGQLIQIKNNYGQPFFFRYSKGKLVKITGPFDQFIELSYNKDGFLKQSKNSKGIEITYVYDEKGILRGTKRNKKEIEKYQTDAKGNLTQIASPDGKPIWKFTYDPFVRVETTTNPFQYTLRYEYETTPEYIAFHEIAPNGGKKTQQRWLDGSQSVQIDLEGGKTISEKSLQTGLVKRIIDPNGNATSYNWDKNNLLKEIVDPLGRKTTFTYPKNGVNVTTITGNEIQKKYDAFNNVIEVINKELGTETFKYDDFGRLIYQKNFDGKVREFQYGNGWLPVSTFDESGKRYDFEFDNEGQILNIKAEGEKKEPITSVLQTLKDSIGFQIPAYDYSQAGKMIQTKDGFSQYVVDEMGNITQMLFPNGSQKKIEYNLKSQPVKVIQDGNVFKTFRYDPVGNIIVQTNGVGQDINYAYDKLNRLISITPSNGDKVAYVYDKKENIIESSYGRIKKQYTYDALSRLTSVSMDKSGKTSVSYSYNEKSRINKIDAPDQTITFARDALNRVSNIDSSAIGKFTFQYRRGNELSQFVYPNGIVVEFDLTSPLTQSIKIKKATKTLSTIQVKKNDLGFTVTRTTDKEAGEFLYDERNQLLSAKYNDKQFLYTYDRWGNRLTETKNSETQKYTYTASGKLLTRGNTTYQWDKNENLLSKKNTTGETRFTYDFNNRLTKIEGTNGAIVSYEYDADGLLISRTSGRNTTRIIYNDANPIAELSKSGKVLRKYLYASGIDQILGMEEKNKKYFFHRDERNNVVLVTDKNGSVAASYRYDPFGNVIDKSGRFESPFLFSGQRYEPLFNLYYMRARFYDPESGRFLSPDPITGDIDEALSTNPYIYVKNNPMNFTDPLGLEGYPAKVVGVIGEQFQGANLKNQVINATAAALSKLGGQTSTMSSFVNVSEARATLNALKGAGLKPKFTAINNSAFKGGHISTEVPTNPKLKIFTGKNATRAFGILTSAIEVFDTQDQLRKGKIDPIEADSLNAITGAKLVAGVALGAKLGTAATVTGAVVGTVVSGAAIGVAGVLANEMLMEAVDEKKMEIRESIANSTITETQMHFFNKIKGVLEKKDTKEAWKMVDQYEKFADKKFKSNDASEKFEVNEFIDTLSDLVGRGEKVIQIENKLDNFGSLTNEGKKAWAEDFKNDLKDAKERGDDQLAAKLEGTLKTYGNTPPPEVVQKNDDDISSKSDNQDTDNLSSLMTDYADQDNSNILETTSSSNSSVTDNTAGVSNNESLVNDFFTNNPAVDNVDTNNTAGISSSPEDNDVIDISQVIADEREEKEKKEEDKLLASEETKGKEKDAWQKVIDDANKDRDEQIALEKKKQDDLKKEDEKKLVKFVEDMEKEKEKSDQQFQQGMNAIEEEKKQQSQPNHGSQTNSGGLQDVTVKVSPTIIRVWDNSAIDGDRVDIFVNGSPLATNVNLTASKKSFSVPLVAGQPATLTVRALNVGTMGSKNSAAVEVQTGQNNQFNRQSWLLNTGETAQMQITFQP